MELQEPENADSLRCLDCYPYPYADSVNRWLDLEVDDFLEYEANVSRIVKYLKNEDRCGLPENDYKTCYWCQVLGNALSERLGSIDHVTDLKSALGGLENILVRFRLRRRKTWASPRFEWREFEVNIMRTEEQSRGSTRPGVITSSLLDVTFKAFDFYGWFYNSFSTPPMHQRLAWYGKLENRQC